MTVGITLNGEAKDVEEGLTVRTLLETLDIAPHAVVVEHNRRVLRDGQYEDARIAAGDEVEIVHFVGGG